MTTTETAGGTEASPSSAAEDPTPGPARLVVRSARADDAAERDRLVRAQGHFFQLSGWERAVERSFGHEPAGLVAERDGRLVGALPLMRCRGPLRRTNLVSMPYGVSAGPVAEDAQVERALVEQACRQAEAERVGRLELRCTTPPAGEGLEADDLYVWFRRRLPDDEQALLPLFPKDERRLVRRARDKHGLEVSEGPWFVEDLARLFHASKRRLGSPGLPLRWFQALQEELGDAVVCHVVRRERELLAVSMSFAHRDTLHMYYIGTTEEANRAYAATSFLIHELERWCLGNGLSVFDLGRSRRDAGAFRFKQNQGFEPEDLHYRYHCVKAGGPPTFTPSNPRTELLRRTWSRLPGWAAVRLSGHLARYLP